MDSLDPKCTPLKQLYEACFYKWYTTTFLKQNSPDSNKAAIQEDPECVELFKKYRECLEQTLQKHEISTSTSTFVDGNE